MVFASKSGKVKEMAGSGQRQLVLNDSLDNVEWHQNKSLMPVKGDVNHSALNTSVAEEVCIGLFPRSVVESVNDQTNWKNRTSGISKMLTTINELPDSSSLYLHLNLTLQLTLTTLNDSHFKVAQMGLELMACIIARVSNRIRSHLPSLVQNIMLKVGSNKYVLKEAGMRVLKELMLAVRPWLVINEIITFGLNHKTSRVREESLNAISVALLSFPSTEFDLVSLVRDLTPSMGDSKSRVRQAALEAAAMACSLVKGPDLKHIISMLTGIQKNNPTRYCVYSGLTMMDAFQARLSRQAVPQLNTHGLVDHVLTVANTKPPFPMAGADVTWIVSAGGVKTQTTNDQLKSSEYPEPLLPQSRQRHPSGTVGASVCRPYRSTAMRLPWETEGDNMVKGHLTIPAVSTPKELAPLSTPVMLSTKHLPATSLANTLPVPRQKSYSDMYLTKLNQPSTPLACANSHPPTNYALTAVPPPTSHGYLSSHRNNLGSLESNNRGVPPTSEDQTPATSGTSLNPDDSLSVTWPLSRGGGSLNKIINKISADVANVTGGVHSSVKTNVSRPLSKPRVRYPLTALKPQPPSKLIVSNSNQMDSPTQLEKGFLSFANECVDGGEPSVWGETSWDEEYFQTIPEDITLLNSSLTCSVSSLCNTKELDSAHTADPNEVDKLKHIRKEIASRKAQLVSAFNSATNSPEATRHSSGDTSKQKVPLQMQDGQELESMSAPVKRTRRIKPLTNHSSLCSDLNATNSSSTKYQSISHTPSTNLSRTHTSGTLNQVSSGATYSSTHNPSTLNQVSSGATYSSTHNPGTLNQVSSGATYSSTHNPGTLNQVTSGTSYSSAYSTKTLVPPLTPLKGPPSQSKNETPLLKGSPTQSKRDTPLKGSPSQSKKKPLKGSPDQSKREIRLIDGHQENSQLEREMEPQRGHSPPLKSREPVSLARRLTVKRSSKNRKAVTMIDTMEMNQPAPLSHISNDKKRPIDYENSEINKNQFVPAASYSSTGRYLVPPVGDNTESAMSVPTERVRKRSKLKKPSPPQKRQSDSCYLTAGDDSPHTYSHRNGVPSDFEMPHNSGCNGSPEGSSPELQPYPSPEHGLRESIHNISIDDWNSKCDGLMGVRRVALYHPGVLLPQLHTVVLAVEKEVKNLRSAVARVAIACMTDLFTAMNSSMEKDIERIVKVLLHKGSESNTFIRQDVEKALSEMVNNLSHSKCLTALINGGLKHRNNQVRKMTSKYICMILESQGPSRFLHSPKDIVDRTLPAIVQLATDNYPESRYYGKRCLHQLWPLSDFDQIASRVLSSPLLSKAKEVIDHLKTKGLGDPPVESLSAKQRNGVTSTSRHSTGGLVRASVQQTTQSSYGDGGQLNQSGRKESISKKPRKQFSTQDSVGVEMPLPDGLLDRLKASNWSERLDGVEQLEEFVSTHPKALAPHLLKVFDVFSPRLTDRNSKVNLRALEAFSNMVTLLCDTLIPVTTNIISALVPNLASRNTTIHSSAMTALDLLSQCIDPVYLIQPIANSAQFGNARVRPIMISKLAELTKAVHRQKPQLISRQVLPVMWHLVSSKSLSTTGDIHTACLALCEALLDTMGSEFLESASHLAMESHAKLDHLISLLQR